MKKIVSLILIFVLLISLALPASAATGTQSAQLIYRGIKIVVGGTEISPGDNAGNKTEPFIIGSTTYLPLRAVANALGLAVQWTPSTSTIDLYTGGKVNYGSGTPAASKGTITTDITYRNIKVNLDGKPLKLAAEPFIMNSNGTTYLPLRAIAEALGLEVSWEGKTSTVYIEQPVWLPVYKCLTNADGSALYEFWEYDDGANCYYHYADDEAGYVLTISTYDSADRLIFEEVTSRSYEWYDSECTFSYNSKGDLTKEVYKEYYTDGYGVRLDSPHISSTATYSYDSKGRLSEKNIVTEELDYGSHVTRYTYTYLYNSEGRLYCEGFLSGGVGQYRTYYYYDAAGRTTQQKTEYADGDIYSEYWEYDSAGRMTRHWDSDGYIPAEVYQYSPAGLLWMVYEDGTLARSYTYDSFGRVTKEVWTDYGTFYSQYDSHGNVIAQQHDYLWFEDCSISWEYEKYYK